MSSENSGSNSSIKKISIISAMTEDGVIGFEGSMPWHISAELKYFKSITMGKPMIMGRKTYDSLGRKSLPGRKTIVLTRDENIPMSNNCRLALTPESAMSQVSDVEEVMIVGGANIYEIFMPIVNSMYISWIKDNYHGDTFFPKVNWDNWHLVKKEDQGEFLACVYERNYSD